MAMSPWNEEEDIALCESWIATVTNNVPHLPAHPFWEHVFQQFCMHRGEATRTMDACFRVIRMTSSRFEKIVNVVDNNAGELTEDDIIQVAIVDCRHTYHRDFKHAVM
ncbi:hypothetical protein Hanom_Chr11g01000811 [Helianthus anomalus]